MTTQTEFHVTGMTCQHCVHAVTTGLTALDGVEAVTVTLQPGAASAVTVVSDRALDRDAVSAAIDDAGYTLTDTP